MMMMMTMMKNLGCPIINTAIKCYFYFSNISMTDGYIYYLSVNILLIHLSVTLIFYYFVAVII